MNAARVAPRTRARHGPRPNTPLDGGAVAGRGDRVRGMQAELGRGRRCRNRGRLSIIATMTRARTFMMAGSSNARLAAFILACVFLAAGVSAQPKGNGRI